MFTPSWFSYAFSGVMALIASWALSGCRFGNRVEEQPQVSDGLTGYYETLPQSMRYCASVPDDHCTDVPTNQIPQAFQEILTNPVILKLQDSASGKSILFSPFGGDYGVPVFVNLDHTLSVLRSSYAETVWDDPACTWQDQELIEGKIVKSNGPWASSAEFTKSGRIELKITYVTSFEGNCAASLQALADCYGDATKCGDHDRDFIRELFSPYVAAGVMGTADILKVSNLAYEIVYQ